MRQRQRRLLMGFFFAAAAPLLVASVAYACQRITPVRATPNSGEAGAQVRVTGFNFSSDGTSSNVEIRWDSRRGPSLRSIAPSALGEKGSFDVTVTVPTNAAIGNHIIIVTQTLANGAPCVGCPGRDNFHVRGAGAQAASNSSAAAPPASDQQTSAPAAATEPAAAEQPAASQPAASQPAAQTAPAAQQPAPAQTAASSQRPVAPPAPSRVAPAASPVAPAPASPVVTPAAPLPASAEASPVAPAPASPSVESAPAPASAGVELVGSSSTQAAPASTPLPLLTLVAGLALVLLGLGAFWRSGRSALGAERGLTPAV